MSEAAASSGRRLRAIDGTGAAIELRYASDHWDARALGIRAQRGRNMINFASIPQGWLREPLKAWCRFRLATGGAYSSADSAVQAFRRFSRFLIEVHPELVGIPGLSRQVIEDYLAWLTGQGLVVASRSNSATFLKTFLDWGRRYGTLVGLRPDAVMYEDDVARPDDALPRFISEFVMVQLENEDNLARLPSRPSARNMVVLLIETGMRRGDASELPIGALIADSVGSACLRFSNSKVSTEQLIPLSEKAAAAVRDQQAYVRRTWPGGSPWLFPGIMDNADGSKPYSHFVLGAQIRSWEKKIGLHDEAGQPVHVHPHQFRHTYATRLINQGVPQHVIQSLLGQASPRMTARYARLFDKTVRAAFDEYCTRRINTAGETLAYDPDAVTADAEWAKHNLARIADSLPNGYCGRPPQQDCPHPNACLTCPDFQTTPEFLQIHRRQADSNLNLLTRAEAKGQARLAENLRRVQDSLELIIPALEALEDGSSS
jgi:integrase